MRGIQKQLEDLSSDLFEAREDIDTAKTDLEDTESNRLITSMDTFKTMLSDGEIIDVTGLHCFVRGCIVTEIIGIEDGIKISLKKPYDDTIKTYGLSDLSDEEIYYLATFLVLLAIEQTGNDKNDDYEDDVNDDEIQKGEDNDDDSSTNVINFPAFTDKTEINENVFWATVNAINWEEVSKLDNSIGVARNTLISLGFSVEQIKQLRDIFIRLQNELVQEIKQEYSDKNFSKSDYTVSEVSDYIIGLGDEIYINIFNGIEDITIYVEPHPIHFIECFS